MTYGQDMFFLLTKIMPHDPRSSMACHRLECFSRNIEGRGVSLFPGGVA